MKIIAMYLPQYHRVKENDMWWGEGYTEWTAVKKGMPLFEGHYQPHIPLKNNYYDLLQKDTMVWQAELMKKYQVYGMCFYHYYFQNGKKILEKPAENLLEWKDIDMPFCFSWANETWARTWSGLSEKNPWNCIEEKGQLGNDNGILLKQDYGTEEDWEKHFYYLLPFFQDKRYIKINNRPIFIIHKPGFISCLPQMAETWKKLANKNGIQEIYMVASNSEKEGFDAYLRQEANYSDTVQNGLTVEYDELCQKIKKNALLAGQNCYLCAFPGYDDTPRRGKAGEVVVNSTPEKFYELMRFLLYLGEKRGNEFTFINAWNEWGEGMHLEPDKKFSYQYLESLRKAFFDYQDISKEEQKMWDLLLNEDKEEKTGNITLYKCESQVRLLDKWLRIKEEGKHLEKYFQEKNYQKISVYGLGKVGKHLLAELKDSKIEIVFGIDKRKDQLNNSFPIYTINEILPKVDAVIVTVIYDFEKIYKELKDKIAVPIISLEEVIDYIDLTEKEKGITEVKYE